MFTRAWWERTAPAAGLLASLASAPSQGDDTAFRTTAIQEVSAGGMWRLLSRDPGLIGGGNGGTGTSINYDDGNLNYGRGLTSLATQGRTIVDGSSAAGEFNLEAVYFYDFVNADGDTEFRRLSREARDRAGRNVYLNEAYIGYRGHAGDASLGVRLGNQILLWSDSPAFGHSIAPVNPVSASRRYQPGNAAKDLYIALPMLSLTLANSRGWRLQAFYQFRFKPSELEAAGTFLSGNDYYSPGARFLQLGFGSPSVPDGEASVITPATPLGSKVVRDADRTPGSAEQLGVRIESLPLGRARLTLAGYAMQIRNREPIVSVRAGTLGGLLHTTASDYTTSGAYFVEYVPHLTVLGTSARFFPGAHTRFNLDYSRRIRQPLQIDDDILLTAGLAPAVAMGTCAPNPSSPTCRSTLAALNRNPLIAARGGITAANAASFFSTEINGYERFAVSQYSASIVQGLPGVLAARQSALAGEVGGLYVHGFKPDFLDASVSIRPDASGARRLGLASGSAWGYRLSTRLDYADVLGIPSVSPSLTWIHDVHGNAPITLGTLLEGNKSMIVATDFRLGKSRTGRVSYRTFLAKGSNADRFSDRDFIAFSLTEKF